jgi:hypothetical protein
MKTNPLSRLFVELTLGVAKGGEAFILNGGDAGLVKSLDGLSAADASDNSNGGATVAAHAQHVRYGLSLMNEWARGGGDPFRNAKWDEAWKVSAVDDSEWTEIRTGLKSEVERWRQILDSGKANELEQTGLISSVAHLAYHLGAIRQISKSARGPKEGTYPLSS